MQALEPPDSFSLIAAQGWLELGNLAEARAELAQISEANHNHPHVLEMRWAVCAAGTDWPAARDLARTLLELQPESPVGWLHYAYALRRVPDGGLPAAWDALLPALEKFPKEATIPYNLACYACQLQRLDEARAMLQRAIAAGGRDTVKKMALGDSDLEALWPEIREW